MGRTPTPRSSWAASSSSSCRRWMRRSSGPRGALLPRLAPSRFVRLLPTSASASRARVDDPYGVVEHVARQSYGRLVAYLSARTHDVAGAEDALGDAFMAAMRSWPRDG